MLPDHELHVVPVISMGNYILEYLFRIVYSDLCCGIYQFFLDK